MKIIWDEPKRVANLDKHGMDFADLNQTFFDTAVVLKTHGERWRAIGINIRGVIAVMKPTAAKKKTYTASDMRAVSDNPEWTAADLAKAKPFDEVFPDLHRGRGPNKAPTKKQVTLRLDPTVLEYFKKGGPGWQSRINDELEKVVKRKIR